MRDKWGYTDSDRLRNISSTLRPAIILLRSLHNALPEGCTRDVCENALLRIGQASTMLGQEAEALTAVELLEEQ